MRQIKVSTTFTKLSASALLTSGSPSTLLPRTARCPSRGTREVSSTRMCQFDRLCQFLKGHLLFDRLCQFLYPSLSLLGYRVEG